MTDQPYTRDEIEHILDREKCDNDDWRMWCTVHDEPWQYHMDAECDKAPLDLLAIIRQLLDQTDQLNALVGTVAEQARRELPRGWAWRYEWAYSCPAGFGICDEGQAKRVAAGRTNARAVRRTVQIGPWEEA